MGDIFNNLAQLNGAISGLSNANSYMAHTSSQFTMPGYKTVQVTVGTMAGLQTPPEDIGQITDPAYYTNLGSLFMDGKLNNKLLGAGASVWALSVGLNFDWLLKGLYIQGRFGYMKLPLNISGIDTSFESLTIGALANYQLVKRIGFAGIGTWRGVSVGTGLIYQRNVIEATIKGETLGLPTSYDAGGGVTMTMDPKFTLNITGDSVVIPIEVSTAVNILFMSFSAGAGVDLMISGANISFKGSSPISVSGGTTTQEAPGSLSGSVTLKSSDAAKDNNGTAIPSWIAPKIMGSVGLYCFGVRVEVPLTWYFIHGGFNVGVNIAYAL